MVQPFVGGPMPDLVNEERLCAWLDAHVPEVGFGALHFEVLKGGITNVVIRLQRGERTVVLRRPPAVPRPDSAKVLLREARVQIALNGSDVPAPRLLGLCEDNSVIGAPFYVMSYIDGWSVSSDQPLPPAFDSVEERRHLALSLVEGIAKLASVDYRAAGLGDFGKPAGFLARQVDRWLAHHASYAESENYAFRPLPGKDEVVDWLRANTPESRYLGIIHGDYGFANVMYRHDTPARLAAIIDWELSTIGDPLLDLGWLLYAFKGRDDEETPPGPFYHPDYPSREELADHYGALTGWSIQNLNYYIILAQFKLAMLLERHYARGLNGRFPLDKGESMGALAISLLAQAAQMTRQTS